MNNKPPKLLSNTSTIGSQGNPTAAGKKEQKVEIPTKRKSSRISQLPSPDYTNEENYEENSEDNYEENYEDNSEDDSEENYESDVSPLADKKRKVVVKKRVSAKKHKDEESLEPQAVEQVQTLLSLRGSSSSSSNVETATAAKPRAWGREPKCSCHRQKSECIVHGGS